MVATPIPAEITSVITGVEGPTEEREERTMELRRQTITAPKGSMWSTGPGGPFREGEDPDYYTDTTAEDDARDARVHELVTDSEAVGDLISCHLKGDIATGGEYAELDVIVSRLCADAYGQSQEAAERRFAAVCDLHRLMKRAAVRKIEKETRP